MVPSFDQWEGTAGRRINDGKKRTSLLFLVRRRILHGLLRMWRCDIAVEGFCDFLRCLSFLFRSDIVIQSFPGNRTTLRLCQSWPFPGVARPGVHHHLDWSLHVEHLNDGWPSSSWKLFIGETHENYPRFSMDFLEANAPARQRK